MKQWDWKITSYEDGKFMLETVHMGEHSRDMELRAINELGRTCVVEALSERAKELQRTTNIFERLV